MKFHLPIALFLATLQAVSLLAAPGVAPTEALSPEQQRANFHLPPGFEIQLVVAEPDIGPPMNLNFDVRGRLWITHSVEYPYPAVGDGEPRDRLTVVERIGVGGRPAKITHFASGLNIPIGNTPLGDGSEALVYSIPNIYHVRDTDGDGQADRREVLYGTFGSQDTHGMVSSLSRWIDGWIYGCHGFSNTSTVRDATGNVVTMNSGNTYRFRADGSRFEQFTWGQVNPFGISFDPWGNLFDSDCHSMPVYMLLRGAYYPSFGKPHDGLGFGPAMIDHGHGSTGICGPAYYAADHFPAPFRDSLFICNPVNCQVHHDRLKQVGSTRLVETQPDFITCDDGWFRPVDLAVGPDGALYVADFYNCIIGHYEVPLEHPRRDRTHGRVWRVIYTGTGGQENGHNRPPLPMPDLAKLTTDQIVRLLGDANLIVRTLATNWLVDIGQTSSAADAGKHRLAACSAIHAAINHTDSSPELRSHGLWVLERLGDMTTADVQRFAADESPQVRTHLIRALAEREPWTSNDYAQVRTAITDGNATVRRVAADALGRHPQPDNLLLLFNLLAETPPEDTHLVHVARMALRDHLRETATLSHVRSSQIGRSQLQTLVELAASVKTPDAAELALDYLERFGTDDPKAADYVAFAAQFLKQDRIAALIQIVRGQSNEPASEFSGLQSIQTGLERRGMRDNPDATVWARQLTDQLLASGKTSVDGRADQFRAGPAARELIARFRLAEYQPRLEQVVRSRESDLATRRQAAETLLTFSPDARLSALLGTLSSAHADTLNVDALNEHILQATLSREDASIAEALAETMLRAPRDVQRQLAETLAGDRAGGNALLQLAEAGKASPRLLLDPAVRNLLNALKLERLDERIAALTSRLPAENEQLLRLIDQRRQQFASAGASAELGRGVFEKHCAACHQIAGKGENVGPQLDGIGGRGLARLIEDVLDPNRNVDPAFRTTTLVLADGRILSGLVRRVEGAAIVLADDKGKELTIAKSDIDEQQLTVLSLMPAGFGESLPADDFQHLMAFLLKNAASVPTNAESPAASRSRSGI